MTPAMRADAAEALMRVELRELGEKLIAMSVSTSPHIEKVSLKVIAKAVARFELMAKEIEAQVAEAKEPANG